MPSPLDSREAHNHGKPSSTITIADLPDEILLNIFGRVLQTSWKDPYLWMWPGDYPKDIPPEESMLSPLRLSQVCRLWCSLATSCPTLWSDITVLICEDDSVKRGEWHLNAVDTWVSRSRLSPLRLMVVCDTARSCLTWCGLGDEGENAHDAPGPKYETTAHILRKLLDHQNRWKDASFTLIGDDPGILLQLSLVDAPLLESMSIYWEGFTQRCDITQINLDILCSPRLRSLHFEGILRIITGGVSNLRELTIGSAFGETSIKQSVFLEILQGIPNLQVLEIKAIHCESDNTQNSFITLARLHTLTVDEKNDFAFLISRLIPPGLKRLVCNPFLLSFSHYEQEFSDMLVRSRPALEYYELSHIRVGGDIVASFLQLMPGLKTLCLVTDPYMPDLFEMLSVKETADSQDINSILCPNLEKLIVKNCGSWNCNPSERKIRNVDSLCNMLQKRCHELGRVGTIECYSAYYPSSFDGEPVYTPENRLYDIPFVDIGCAGMRETLANQARLDIRFEKLFAIEG